MVEVQPACDAGKEGVDSKALIWSREPDSDWRAANYTRTHTGDVMNTCESL